MGCVFGKGVSGKAVERKKAEEEEDGEAVRVAKKEEGSEIRNGGGNRKENNEVEVTVRPPRGERKRSSKPNPRLSNPPKHVHGEQVAAGWPSWLSAVAGEAINGWTPRRADTFEKLDKVS